MTERHAILLHESQKTQYLSIHLLTHGLIRYAAYKQLQWLYADWVDGIRVKTADASSEQRVAPLRLLEHQLRTKTHVAPWRSGNKIAKAVAERKVLVYAILRGLPDSTGGCLYEVVLFISV